MLDHWPTSCYSNDRSASVCRFDQPALGICFDTGRISSGKYGQTCWEILWRAVEPRQIAGSQLLEGSVLESDDVYCLALQNFDAWRLGYVIVALKKDADFLNASASPGFLSGEDVLREPLVAAGQVNEAGVITGISNNPRMALNKVKREREAALKSNVAPSGAVSGPRLAISPVARMQTPVAAQAHLKKWWHVWKT